MRTQGRHCRPPPALPPTSADSPWKHCEEKSGICDCFRRVQVPNIRMPMSSWWLLSLHLTLRISTLSSSLRFNCFWNILSEILHRHLRSMYFLKGVYYLPLTLVLSLSLFLSFFNEYHPNHRPRGNLSSCSLPLEPERDLTASLCREV